MISTDTHFPWRALFSPRSWRKRSWTRLSRGTWLRSTSRYLYAWRVVRDARIISEITLGSADDNIVRPDERQQQHDVSHVPQNFRCSSTVSICTRKRSVMSCWLLLSHVSIIILSHPTTILSNERVPTQHRLHRNHVLFKVYLRDFLVRYTFFFQLIQIYIYMCVCLTS